MIYGHIYVFRHAESEDNRHHIFSGWRDVDLSEKGVIDAQELAELLKDKIFTEAYTSDLKRNLETVNEVLKYHPDVPITQDKRLRERCYGDLQGKHHLDLMRQDLNLYLTYHRSYKSPPPKGESIAMVEERVLPFCNELEAKIKQTHENVIVCAGNNAMRVIRRYLEGITIEQMMKIENPYDNFFEYEVKD